MVMDEVLRPAACEVAARLRKSGRTVDLILEPKKMKQVFKVDIVELMPETSACCILDAACGITTCSHAGTDGVDD